MRGPGPTSVPELAAAPDDHTTIRAASPGTRPPPEAALARSGDHWRRDLSAVAGTAARHPRRGTAPGGAPLGVEAPIDLTDPAARRAEVTARLASLPPLVEAGASKVAARLSVVDEVLETAPALHDWAGDEITRLENAWERAAVWSLPTVASAGDSEQLRRYLEQAEHSLRRVIQYAARLTIPTRLNDHLAALRPGPDAGLPRHVQ